MIVMFVRTKFDKVWVLGFVQDVGQQEWLKGFYNAAAGGGQTPVLGPICRDGRVSGPSISLSEMVNRKTAANILKQVRWGPSVGAWQDDITITG